MFDFVDQFERDRDAGRSHAVEHYLERFPGHEEALREEYARLLGAVEGASDSGAVGRQVGPYVIEEELGRGGQGTVYLATKGDDRIWAYDTRNQTIATIYDRATTPEPDAPRPVLFDAAHRPRWMRAADERRGRALPAPRLRLRLSRR